MPIEFFTDLCKSSTNSDRFGLCDDPPPSKAPAYIDENDDSIWVAEVQNPNNLNVEFIAIDNCIDIKRPDGSMERRCDGMLNYKEKLFFIELKDRTYSGWVADGREQLTTTFNVFKSNLGTSPFTNIEGYICNKQRPFANSNHMVQIQKFFNDTGLKLKIQKVISL